MRCQGANALGVRSPIDRSRSNAHDDCVTFPRDSGLLGTGLHDDRYTRVCSDCGSFLLRSFDEPQALGCLKRLACVGPHSSRSHLQPYTIRKAH
jgi:hypothetical protein